MPESSSNILVSVVIPCRNEAKYISYCIDSLLAGSNGIPIEIIVVDGQSTDNTREIISLKSASNYNIRLIENSDRFTPFGLNAGIKDANGKYILIASSHSAYPPDYISVLLKEINELQADGIGGVMKTEVLRSTRISESIRIALTHPFGVGNSLFRTGIDEPMKVDTVPFGLYRKSFFNEVGLYNTELIRNHDIELSKRALAAGKSIYLTPSVSCVYYARESYGGVWKNNFRNGLWNLKTVFITKNLRSLSLRHFVPLLFILSLILPVIPALLWMPLFLLISALSALAYILFLIVVSLKTKKKNTNTVHVITAFLILHFSYGCGSMAGLFHFYRLMK